MIKVHKKSNSKKQFHGALNIKGCLLFIYLFGLRNKDTEINFFINHIITLYFSFKNIIICNVLDSNFIFYVRIQSPTLISNLFFFCFRIQSVT